MFVLSDFENCFTIDTYKIYSNGANSPTVIKLSSTKTFYKASYYHQNNQGVYFIIVPWADNLERSMHSDSDWIWFGLPEKWVITIGFLSAVIFKETSSKENHLNCRISK